MEVKQIVLIENTITQITQVLTMNDNLCSGRSGFL